MHFVMVPCKPILVLIEYFNLTYLLRRVCTIRKYFLKHQFETGKFMVFQDNAFKHISYFVDYGHYWNTDTISYLQ